MHRRNDEGVAGREGCQLWSGGPTTKDDALILSPLAPSTMSYILYPSTQPASAAASIGLFMFDLDGTLIVSKSGRAWTSKTATVADDWIFTAPTVPATLQRFANEGYRIALVTNQSAWGDGPKAKVESVLARLQELNGWAPACAVASGKDSVYRKPGRGLFDVVGGGAGQEIHMCGDAVGADDPYPPYRWSDSDSKFAAAVGATFHRPADIPGLTSTCDTGPLSGLVILMGNPGSGKSTLGRKLMLEKGFVHVEQDVVGTPAAVRKAVVAGLNSGSSVVVDATHGNPKNREPWAKIARERKIPCRIVWIVRDGRPFNAIRTDKVPEVAYAVYSKYFVEPTEDCVTVSWV